MGVKSFWFKSYSTLKARFVPISGTYPLGFRVGGQHIGIKEDPKSLDLALLVSDKPCSASALFTKNVFQAAPVIISERILSKSSSKIRAIVINSGCANAVTGQNGLLDAEAMAYSVDKLLFSENSTLVMSTGVIGQRLVIDKITKGIPNLHLNIGSTHKHWLACANAICTTDTFPKLRSSTFNLGGKEFRIAGIAKGAGMIHPNMATLLGFAATDASISPEAVKAIISYAVDKSFNSITVDGDTSTNDTVALLANGEGGGPVIHTNSPDFSMLKQIITGFFQELAQLVIRDGEGATKFVAITVQASFISIVLMSQDAKSADDAKKVASSIAKSPLVKTALFGQDANWGRILAAIGYAGVDVNPQTTSVSFLSTTGGCDLPLLENGEPVQVDESYASEILKEEDIEIKVSLGTNGGGSARMWTCDFSHEVFLEDKYHANIKYISINAEYRS
ncbi:Arginine biosynthesis bifunctional protein ArgJ, mitochondrial [Neolecta irregularis DAH-3]|uniref:Arginine biosynthesis bifunctional protein ArgJ, mitochondrial n=1 Tax=Neolecta irregularis (strain DAH-3) TaxID=1198029 RepID=A0A1U7LTQ3_NEOID|nr:Arginine biosynthesis bifunctional protein ArgJ, mitochondrial [Neolecta irregularis DAH-3]|eukprot:OLL25963.1 Arginine biosynthesis bifunctional protein ArgJ, mitochondrial [Neolecta irregularis DAH-3]